jgi:hypothetical protein
VETPLGNDDELDGLNEEREGRMVYKLSWLLLCLDLGAISTLKTAFTVSILQ